MAQKTKNIFLSRAFAKCRTHLNKAAMSHSVMFTVEREENKLLLCTVQMKSWLLSKQMHNFPLHMQTQKCISQMFSN